MYYYIGTVILKLSCREFWHTTPRKLSALVEVHVELNTPKDTPKRPQATVDGVPMKEIGKGIPNSRKPGEGVGEPNAFIDQIL